MTILERLKRSTTYYSAMIFCYLFYSVWEQFMSFGGGNFNEDAAASYFSRLIDKLAYLRAFDIPIQILIVLIALCLGIMLAGPVDLACSKLSGNIRTPLYIANAAVLFVSYNGFKTFYSDYGFSGISLSFVNVLFISGLTLAGAAYISKNGEEDAKILSGYTKSRGIEFAYYAVWILVAFLCSGEYLFLADTGKAWTLNVKTLSLFIMFMIWVRPFIDYLLVFIEKRSAFAGETRHLTAKENVIIWLLMLVPLGVYFALAYPAIESVDSVTAWGEISDGDGYSYAFPIFVKIIWQLLYSIWPSFAIVTIFQCVLWMLTVYAYLLLFAKRGMNIKALYAIAFVTCAFTSFNLFVLMHSTNIYYVLAMLWLTYLLVRYFEGKVSTIPVTVGMSLSMAILSLCRNEGTITLALLVFCVAIYALIRRKPLLLIASIIAVILSVVVKGPVFDAFGASSVSLNNNTGINILVNDITLATVHFDGKLSDESINSLTRYASTEEIDKMWRNFDYDSYAPAKLNPLIQNKSEVFPIAFDAIIHNIPIAIRERLNKSENVWSVTQYKDAVNARRSVNAKENESLIYKILFRVLYYPTFMIPVLDILLYRSGIWLCFMLILSVYLIKNKRGEEMLIYAPAIAHAIVLVLSLLWLCARHTWCINLTGMVMLGMVFTTRKNSDSTGIG